MDLRELAAADLNLLVTLAALMETKSVTAAARRMGVTQPAMSRSLGRLRDLFGDSLLVRGRGAMVATPRGARLALALPQVLEGVSALLSLDRVFDVTATRRFAIAMTDYAALTILPRLLERVQARAPQVSIDVIPLRDWASTTDALERGALDAAVGFEHAAPKQLALTVVGRDSFMCAVRADHPHIRRRLTLSRYAETGHVLVSTRGRVSGVVDGALERRGLTRRVAVVVPQLMAVPPTLMHGDLVATVPARLRSLSNARLRWFGPPLALPDFAVVLAQHQDHRRSPAHVWLRAQIEGLNAT